MRPIARFINGNWCVLIYPLKFRPEEYKKKGILYNE